MRVGHRADRRPGYHSPAGASRRRRGRVVLADGLQEDAERQRPAASSDPSAQSDVHESRPDVRTIAGLFDMILKSFLCTYYYNFFFFFTIRLGACVVRVIARLNFIHYILRLLIICHVCDT